MKKHHPIYSIVRRDNQIVRNALKSALDECEDRSVDGAIIILSRNNGKTTTQYLAGALGSPDKAAFESFILQLAMGIEKANR